MIVLYCCDFDCEFYIYVVFSMDNLSCFVNMNASGNNCFPFMVESILLRLATEFTTGISQFIFTNYSVGISR